MSSAGCNAGCQSLAPFTDHIVHHFLVQTVPFILDTLAQLFDVRDSVYTLVGSPTPCSPWGSNPTVRRPCRLSCQDCEPCAADRYATRTTFDAAISVNLTQYILTPLNVQCLFGHILSIFVAPESFCCLNTFIVCLSSIESGILCNS